MFEAYLMVGWVLQNSGDRRHRTLFIAYHQMSQREKRARLVATHDVSHAAEASRLRDRLSFLESLLPPDAPSTKRLAAHWSGTDLSAVSATLKFAQHYDRLYRLGSEAVHAEDFDEYVEPMEGGGFRLLTGTSTELNTWMVEFATVLLRATALAVDEAFQLGWANTLTPVRLGLSLPDEPPIG